MKLQETLLLYVLALPGIASFYGGASIKKERKMGYDIFSKDENFGQSLNIAGWQSLMGLACVFGWEPQGTVLTSWKDNKTGEMFPLVCCDAKKCIDGQWVKDDSWPGSYSSNSYQEITANDAKNFAAALEKALEHMSGNRNSEMEVTEELDELSWDDDPWITREDLINAWSEFDAQETIKGFIELFKSGTCYIV